MVAQGGELFTVFSVGVALFIVSMVVFCVQCCRPKFDEESYGIKANGWVCAMAFTFMWYGGSFHWSYDCNEISGTYGYICGHFGHYNMV